MQTHKEKGPVKTEVGLKVMHLQAKNCWQFPESRREAWNGFSLRSFRTISASKFQTPGHQNSESKYF